jgi:hypothetical protein
MFYLQNNAFVEFSKKKILDKEKSVRNGMAAITMHFVNLKKGIFLYRNHLQREIE